MSCLIEELKSISDHRKARGKRYPLWVLLLLILMGMMAGYRGYRPLQTFVSEYYAALSELIGIELSRVPSFSTFRRTMLEIDLEQLSDAFEMWMLQQPELVSLCTGGVAIDGKRIRQPIEMQDGKQRLVGLVSLFASQSGVSLKLQALTEEENHEIEVVRTLLKTLKLEGLIITMDALHAQKNTASCA